MSSFVKQVGLNFQLQKIRLINFYQCNHRVCQRPCPKRKRREFFSLIPLMER